MNLRRMAATAALTVAAVGVASAGTANAVPAPWEIGYDAKLVGRDVVTTLNGGFFAVEGNQVAVRNAFGHNLVVLPLTYNLGDREFPIDQRVSPDGRTLTMTPVTDVARSWAEPSLLHNVASTAENQRAMEAFSAQLGIATAVGGLIGLGIGAVAGGIIGAGGVVTGPGAFATIPGGIIAGATIGSIIGTLAVGGPTLLIAGIDLASTLSAPPDTTKFAR